MLSRAVLIVLALFWVTMNVLLWRVEFAPRSEIGIAVPEYVVWRKVLTAPDSSSLNVLYHGRKIGVCHWATRVSEEADQLAEKPLRSIISGSNASGYQIQFEGNMFIPEAGGRVRFDGTLKLATDETWQQINLRLSLRRITWKLTSDAAEKKLYLKVDDGELHIDRAFLFSDLKKPETWLREFSSPFISELMSGAELPNGLTDVSKLTPGLRWEAHDDTIQIRHALVRVYRLETKLLNRYKIVIIVSHVGEILRVELPDEIVLLHELLTNT